MYATKKYCMFLSDRAGKAPVMFVYIVPSLASVRVAKQNISWTAQALWGGYIRSNLARARTMLA